MRWITIIIFVVAACLVWTPVHVRRTLYETRSVDPVPAGEIDREFSISQKVVPASDAPLPIGNSHNHCFGIRFATYMRRNSGRLEVAWQQGQQRRQWRIRAPLLADNQFRYFCPGHGFSAWRPFQLRVTGINGTPGGSATLWLTGDTRAGTVESGNEAVAGKALMLDVVEDRRIGLGQALGVNRGAFLFGWLCTLAVAIAVLLQGPGGSRKRTRREAGPGR